MSPDDPYCEDGDTPSARTKNPVLAGKLRPAICQELVEPTRFAWPRLLQSSFPASLVIGCPKA